MTNLAKPQSDQKQIQKTRKCLMCLKAFLSLNFGHRICRKCKDTSTWKAGIA